VSIETLRRLCDDSYRAQDSGMSVGLPRVNVDASQLKHLLDHYDAALNRIAQLEAQLAEALARWGETDHELTEVQVENARLRAGYAEAIEDIADWACYADEYFQRKHDLAGTLAKHQAVLAGQGGESHDLF